MYKMIYTSTTVSDVFVRAALFLPKIALGKAIILHFPTFRYIRAVNKYNLFVNRPIAVFSMICSVLNKLKIRRYGIICILL